MWLCYIAFTFYYFRAIRKNSNKEKQIYALEIVYDAEDAWKNSNSIIDRYLWKKIDENMRTLSYNADGISCVTEYYLQKHYYSKKKVLLKTIILH